MESRREQVARARATPIRSRRISCVLVKTLLDREPCFLFEWDVTAAQYQLIGGRIDVGEDPETAAVQEFMEEVVLESGQLLEHGRDFRIRALEWVNPPPLTWTGVSRSVGALTRYEVWAFATDLRVEALRLGDRYRWLSLPEMMAGRARSGKVTGDPALFRILDASLTGGLENVPLSIGGESVSGAREPIDRELG
jgi:8-oxo-dGTP pyrophosphatase MutT (NUDIX family)